MTNLRVGLVRLALIGGLLLLAVLFAGHDSTWAMVVSFALGIVAFVLLTRAQPPSRGRGRGPLVLAFVACFLVLVGGTGAVRAGWIDAFGRDATATVSHVASFCTGKNTCQRREGYTLRLADGDTVPGDLRAFRPGSYQVGDRVTVRYDPLGLVRKPDFADRSPSLDEYGGLALAVAGLVLVGVLVTPRRRRTDSADAPGPAAPVDPQRSNL